IRTSIRHMRNTKAPFLALVAAFAAQLGCATAVSTPATNPTASMSDSDAARRLAKYTTVKLEPNLTPLSANERRMIPLLIDAAKAMDEVFWVQAYGDRAQLLGQL